MKSLYTVIVCLLGAGIGYYLYEKYIKRPLFLAQTRKYDKFCLEDLLSWFKQHEIKETMDCCVINDSDTTKYGIRIQVESPSKEECFIVLAIYNEQKKVHDAVAIVYKDLDADIKALIKDKKIIIVE